MVNEVVISVIIPCYNQGVFLEECVSSVINQSYSNWECIIVDDGSTDNSREIIVELMKNDARIRMISKLNGGVCSARNIAINNAVGQFILPLDADDCISSNYLELTYNSIVKSALTKVVFGAVEFFGDVNGQENRMINFQFSDHLYYNQIHCSGLFYRKDAISIDGYDETMIHGYEDWDFYIRLLNGVNDAIQLNNCTLYYRKKSISRSTILNTGRKEMLTMNHLVSKNVDQYTRLNINLMNEIRLAREIRTTPESLFSYKFVFNLLLKKIFRTLKIR